MLGTWDLSLRRELFWEVGGFDQEYPVAGAEDQDFSWRAILAGLSLGGEWRSLLPRASDGRGALFMAKHYLGTPFALLRRRRRVPPRFNSQYNPLQRLAYFSIPMAGFLSVVTGWAIHKPMQLSWVAALFGGFDRARVWHFWLMCLFIAFVVPHVVLVFADGWDTVRSMITGRSTKLEMGGQSHEP